MKKALVLIMATLIALSGCKPEKTEYTVTFDTAGGYGCATTMVVEEGETIYLPTVYKDGFNFTGWLHGLSTVYNAGDPYVILQDEHFEALWNNSGNLPIADFSAYTNGSYEITFINESTGATSYVWEFGDGQTSTEVSPKHTYPEINLDKAYHCKLTATNTYGSQSHEATINVNPRGTLKLVSTTSDPYDIFLDDVYQQVINGHETKEYELRPGYHKVRVLQKDGYMIYPTDDTENIEIKAGYITTVEFNNDGLHYKKMNPIQ